MNPSFYEFFAGGGMVRAGLGEDWRCLFANDFDRKKAATYRLNWAGDQMVCDDVRNVATEWLPEVADLAWASFPCQDLSLAGVGAGLKGERSGTFWQFSHLMSALAEEGRAPTVIALENVCGTLTSHGGDDFRALCQAMSEAGYRYGAMVVDAALFVPQSRPRLILVAVREGAQVPDRLCARMPSALAHPAALRSAANKLPDELKQKWIWWSLGAPPPRNLGLCDLIEDDPHDVPWHTSDQTAKLLAMMSDLNLRKVRAAKALKRKIVGTIYKRTRRDDAGRKVQRAEVRFDDVSGCLRTPVGGSSRQLILVIEGPRVRSRLMSSRETARLMGLSDDYILPDNYNEAYHLTGDGVVVPVVRFLADQLFEPILAHQATQHREAA